MGLGGQRYSSAALPLEMTRCSLHRRLGGPRGRSGQVRKITPLPTFNPWTDQPVARVALPAVPSRPITDILNFLFNFSKGLD